MSRRNTEARRASSKPPSSKPGVAALNLPAVPPRLELDPSRDPWDIQPRENPKHYGYFTLYRDMPPQRRTIKGVADLAGISVGRCYGLSGPLLWQQRAQAHDMDVQRRRAADLYDARQTVIDVHLRVSDEMLRVVRKKLATLDPEKISLRDLPAYVQVAGDLARKALGMDAGQQRGPVLEVSASAGGDTDGNATHARVEVRQLHTQALQTLDVLMDKLAQADRAEAAAWWQRTVTGADVEGVVVADVTEEQDAQG